MSPLYDAALKAEMTAEKRMLQQTQRGLLAVLDRCQRVAIRRTMTGEEALALTKRQVRDYFAAEIAARKVSV
ncbi:MULTISPECIES: hypothetical protein [unclassified Caballeronia]|uniref:hypothetical protein n=1 Tax=unclassified Caballeronia TaxID=2646786 RepID=UPI002854571C|nr:MULTISPECIES: hypothetical protein [unclassified Caballeronia]MDR5771796.1 hypothetical protein [Caballeronia sp. LZ002]MDR5847231.1 hypothetical protein [Caballeronia sp. LZ003]